MPKGACSPEPHTVTRSHSADTWRSTRAGDQAWWDRSIWGPHGVRSTEASTAQADHKSSNGSSSRSSPHIITPQGYGQVAPGYLPGRRWPPEAWPGTLRSNRVAIARCPAKPVLREKSYGQALKESGLYLLWPNVTRITPEHEFSAGFLGLPRGSAVVLDTGNRPRTTTSRRSPWRPAAAEGRGKLAAGLDTCPLCPV